MDLGSAVWLFSASVNSCKWRARASLLHSITAYAVFRVVFHFFATAPLSLLLSLSLSLSLSFSLFLNLSYFLSIRQVTLYSRRREGRGAGDKATSIPGRIKKQCSKVSLQATVMRSDEMNGTDCKVAITGFNCSTLCVALFSFSLSPCSSFPCH